MATRVQQPTRAPGTPPGRSARSSATSTTCCSLATGGLIAYGLWVLESVTRNDDRRRSRLLRLPPGWSTSPSAPSCWRSPLPSTPTSTDVSAGRSTPSPSCCSSAVLRARRRGARVEALDRDRLLQLPAVGARQGRCSSSSWRAAWPNAGTASREWGTTLGVLGISRPLMVLVFKEPDFGTTLIYAAIAAGRPLLRRHALAAPGCAWPSSPAWRRRRFSGSCPRPALTSSSRTSGSA